MLKRLILTSVLCMAGPLAAQQQIAFTWDDLPAHSALPPGETRQQVIEQLIATMKAERLPAPYGFVNAHWVDEQPQLMQVLDAWRAAGFPLGNHLYSHMNLNDPSVTLQQWEADVLKDEPVLRREMGDADFRYLRFPYLSEGNTPDKRDGARQFLRQHGYRIAGVTMSFADYAYNEPYARCMARGDAAAIKQLEEDYLAQADVNLAYVHSMAMALYGHDIPYILLMHVGALDAKLLPRLLALYRQRGAQFISLQAALQAPFYANDVDLKLPASPDTLEAAMAARGLPLPPRKQALDVSGMCSQQPAR